MSEESVERINRVLNAAQGPFHTRGRQRFRYDEAKWYTALRVMPELNDDERRHVVAFLTRTKRMNEQDAAWLLGGAYSSVAGAVASVIALGGLWRAVGLGIAVGLGSYLQTLASQTHEPAAAYAEGLLAALAETPRVGKGDG